MDLQDQLIESSKERRGKGAGKFSIASIALHGFMIAGILFMSATATHKVAAEKPIRAFLASNAAPPPPPPPPPAASSAPRSTPTIKPVQIPKSSFVQPTEIPKELPKVEAPMTSATNVAPSQPSEPAGEPGGVPGGVAGGVQGGVQGGVVGGTVGGQLGGVLGGAVGGTGEAKEPEPPKPEGPLRVGGDVKAPVVIKRVEPMYPDTARKAKIAGVVIVEAIIDKDGNVDKAKVLKGLSMGLSEAAIEAVKHWKFKPGTLNGEPVDVIFNLTVNFKLE
ncbi:MAG TPA: energy transducer TonB [Thermoanaerobaculia bacterium]|nr:energy transducer TonB [Thermoanaerobaculia bacterium]